MRRAVQDERLHLVYQPKFRLRDNQLTGVEALVRWHDAEHGEIPPTRFIEIAEDSGLVLEMGSCVVRTACRQLRAWLDRGFAVPIAINVSGKELLHGNPARVIENEAAAAGVPASLIEVEITESLLVKDSAAVRSALKKLRQLGCRIALDDFGTGYLRLPTSLASRSIGLRSTRHSCARWIARQATPQSPTRSCPIGQSLDLIVTAEGIERPGQLEWLRSRGCHEAQGFLLSRPLSPSDLERRVLMSADADPRAGDEPVALDSTPGARRNDKVCALGCVDDQLSGPDQRSVGVRSQPDIASMPCASRSYQARQAQLLAHPGCCICGMRARTELGDLAIAVSLAGGTRIGVRHRVLGHPAPANSTHATICGLPALATPLVGGDAECCGKTTWLRRPRHKVPRLAVGHETSESCD